MAHLLTPDQAAERLGIRKRHVYDLVREHRLPTYRVGRLLRFDPEDLDAWLLAHRQAAASPVPEIFGGGS